MPWHRISSPRSARPSVAGGLAAVLALTVGVAQAGQPPYPGVPVSTAQPPDARFAEVRATLVERIAGEEIPSVSVAVVENGRFVWVETFGWADLPSRRAATVDTAYLLGSLAKALTAAVVLGLVEDGQLSLDDPVDRWVQVRREARGSGSLTLRHLLDSTGGIPHGWRSLRPGNGAPRSTAEWDEWLSSNVFVAFPPGVVFEYSNLSFGVAARVAERVAGEPFDQLIARRLFEPLNMTSSFARREAAPEGLVATPYAPRDGSYVAVRGGGVPEAGLGMYAAARDLVRLGASWLGHDLADQRPALSPATLAMLRQPGPGPGRPFFHFGLWKTGRSLVANGNVSGGNAHLALVPASDAVVAVVTNATGFVADETAEAIVTRLVGPEPGDHPNSRASYARIYDTPLSFDAVLNGRWTGTLALPDGARTVTLTVAGERATLQIEGGPELALAAPVFNQFRELRGSLSAVPLALGGGAERAGVAVRQEGDLMEGYLLLRGVDAVPYPLSVRRRE